ncbi:CDP-diacylglycerol--glycerol-3-phosphate 3-phosphatidyltransferase [Caldicellulosiruptoraceae bacterium PP1]
MLNLPNILTVFRLFLIPLFVIIFFSNNEFKYIYSIFIFLLSGFTDILDGYLARKYNQITNFGKLIDPLADKLLIIVVLWCLVLKNFIPEVILIIIILKEVLMIIGSLFLYKRVNIVVSANIYGKLATFMFYLSIILLLLKIEISRFLLYIAVSFALLAMFIYISKYLKEFKYMKAPSDMNK